MYYSGLEMIIENISIFKGVFFLFFFCLALKVSEISAKSRNALYDFHLNDFFMMRYF